MDTGFPGGSKSKVNKAGDMIREDPYSIDALYVILVWRAAHRHVLNTFQALIRNRIKKFGINAVVAQRHKRLSTIIDKLRRYPNMKLSRMDDVAGIRVIFNDIENLYKFREFMHKTRARHSMKNDKMKYDYISKP